MTKRAFAIAAHPDDIEFVMAGTLILLKRAGYEIHYMNVANGCCGSKELIPAAPAESGPARLWPRGGLSPVPPQPRQRHGGFYDDRTVRRLAAFFREVAPEILLHARARPITWKIT